MFESDQQSPGLCLHSRRPQREPDPFNPADPHDDRRDDDNDNDDWSQKNQDVSPSHFGFGQCNTIILHRVDQFLISDEMMDMDSAITKKANFLDPSIVRLITGCSRMVIKMTSSFSSWIS